MAKLLFAPVPVGALGDRRLSGLMLRVLCAIAFHDRFGLNGMGCHASRQTLADIAGGSPTSVSTAVTALCRLGYVGRYQAVSDARRFSYGVKYRQQPFARIPWNSVLDRTMSEAELRTLGAIAMYDHGRGSGCFASRSTLAKAASLRTDTVSTAIAGLVERGYVQRGKASGDRRRHRLWIVAFNTEIFRASRGQPPKCSPADAGLNGADRRDRLAPANIVPDTRLASLGSNPFEIRRLESAIYSLKGNLNKSDEAEINPEKTGSPRPQETRTSPCTSGSSDSREVAIGSPLQSMKEARSLPRCTDTKLVAAFVASGMNTEQAWLLLQDMPPEQLDALRSKQVNGEASTGVLTAARDIVLEARVLPRRATKPPDA